MSKKRKREPEPALLTLAGIYDKLADESEEQRMGAAHTLLKDFQPKAVSIEQIKVIITRLFRGLCSSRKAARLGFSVALTEYLVELSVQRGASVDSGIPASQIIDILDNETTPEGNNSGQDERDHYFGRLFGAEAVIKSNILVKQQDLVQWKRLLDLICGIANKKPWLKQECGWILYNRIKSFAASDISIPDDFVLDVMEKLTVHKLIRTPEGLAIWLEVSEAFPDVKLPKQVWKHRDPLSKKDISLLADVLKDAKTRDNSDEEEHKSQGKAIWSAQLHFAWDVVLLRLYQQVGASSNGHANGSIVKSDYKSIDLNTFWVKAVEESLFASTSSPERKHWGLLLLRKVLIEAPEPQLRCVFTKNAMTCLMNALKDDDRYLQRTAQKVVQSLRKRAEVEPDTIAVLLEALLVGAGYTDFDAISKTKTVEKLLNVHNWAAQLRIVHTLDACFRQPGTDDARDAVGRRRQVVALQGKMLSLHMSRTENVDIWTEKDYAPKANPPLDILHGWIDAGFFADDSLSPVVSTETRELIKSRLVTHLEQALKMGKYGKWLLQRSIFYLLNKDVRKRGQSVIDFDETVRIVVEKGFDIALSLPRSWDVSVPSAEWSDATSFSDGLLLLFCMTFLQIYNSDTEAVEILEDLIAFHQTSAKKQKSTITTTEDQSDALVEILLSFASKQSKFLRRMTNIIFEGLAPQITSKGLKSLVRILATKENVEGQQEMFDAADEDVGTEDNGDSDGSDVDMLDSDVEIIGASHSSSTTLESDNESDTEDTDDQGEDEELAAFDAKLAAALGTRKMPNGVDDDDDSSSASGASDTDMDDDQMMVLDDKLAEVFRARQQETSKKREKKDAKETIVNFKNRVLDLIEVYLKVEYLASQSLDMILPLLHLARKTKTKQLADRACNVLNEFCKRCKGVIVPACNDALAGIELLLALHTEAGTGASNAHANAASHASILVVKSLVNSGVEIGEVVDVYAETQKRMLTDKKCKVQAGLFTDWNNWCVSVKERFAE